MSQSPYMPPSQDLGGSWVDPYAPLLIPARRAGLLMVVLGALAAAGSGCLSVVVAAAWEQVLAASPDLVRAELANKQDLMQIVYVAMGVIGLLFGVGYIVLGIFVRRGGLEAAITALVLTIVATLLLLVNVIGSASMLFDTAANQATALMGVCMTGVPLALLVLLLVWLIEAVRNAPKIKAARQYQAAYWQQQYPQPWQPPPSPPTPPPGNP